MNKLILLGIAATLGAAKLAFFPANPPVDLQPTSPGTAQAGHLNIDGTATVGLLKSQGTVFGQATAPTGISYGGFFTAASNQARGFYGYASSPTGLTYGGFFQNASDQGRAVYGLATSTTGSTNYGGYFQSAGTAGRGVQGVAAATSGTTYGVYGASSSNAGRAVFGDATSTSGVTYGGSFQSSSVAGRGVYGVANSGSGTTYGGLFQSNSTVGRGVAGTATATSGINYGGLFQASSPDGRAVAGLSSATTGNGYGVYGESASTSGHGVYGFAKASTGENYGVFGVSHGTQGVGVKGYSTDGRYGVHGQIIWGTGVAYGVYSSGNFAASGTKAFRIDHPFDPENKYLLHYCSESPSPQNFYSGNIVTDERGYAWVVLPEYFSEINKNFKYQLTVISGGEDFLQAMVSKKISGNRFQIRTSAPSVEVSWRVEADRNDLYVRNKPTSDVEEKVGVEKGKYQYPEFYGKPDEMGTFYEPADWRLARPAVSQKK